MTRKSLFFIGGENEIRTRGSIATTHAFQACALNHSAISPRHYYNSCYFNFAIPVAVRRRNLHNNSNDRHHFDTSHKFA